VQSKRDYYHDPDDHSRAFISGIIDRYHHNICHCVLIHNPAPILTQLEQQKLLAAREAEYMSLMEAAGIQINAHNAMDKTMKVLFN
jgi:hypothetical protein